MAEAADLSIIPGFIVHVSRKPLGEGTFGKVYEASHQRDKAKAAAKQIRYAEPNEEQNEVLYKMAEKEIQNLMTTAGHPNIVEYYNHYDDGSSLWIAMQYCELGDLDHYLLNHNTDPDLLTKLDLITQCVRGIAFLHTFSPPLVHRDIKLKNFLVTAENGKHVIKVTDFGVAKLVEDTPFGKATMSMLSNYMNTFAGTPPFMAPEFFEMDSTLKYTSSVDIFSLGLVMQTILNFSKDNPQTLPSLVTGAPIAGMSIGMLVCNCGKSGMPMPDIVKIEENDPELVQKIKSLIKDMTKYDPKSRMKLYIVEDELEYLQEKYSETEEKSLAYEKTANENSDSSEEEDITTVSKASPAPVCDEEREDTPKDIAKSKKQLPWNRFTMTQYDDFKPVKDRKSVFVEKTENDSAVKMKPEAHTRGRHEYKSGIPKKSNVSPELLNTASKATSAHYSEEDLKKFNMTVYESYEGVAKHKNMFEAHATSAERGDVPKKPAKPPAKKVDKAKMDDYEKRSNQYEGDTREKLQEDLSRIYDVTNIDDFTPLMERMKKLGMFGEKKDG